MSSSFELTKLKMMLLPSSSVVGGTKKRTRKSSSTRDRDLHQQQQQHDHDHHDDDEERVSLVDPLGRPSGTTNGLPGKRTSRRQFTPTTTTSTLTSSLRSMATAAKSSLWGITPRGGGTNHHPKSSTASSLWKTPRRLMRYLSLTVISAFLTFFILSKESKALHWQEFHHLLEPQLKVGQSNCYSDRRHGQNERCTCPDPSVPLAGSSPVWNTYHNQLVLTANQHGTASSTNRLDIVFLGDAIVERWQGTSDLGRTILAKDMKEPFQSRFVKKNGGYLEGLALGASSDTGPNLLWRIQNGMINNINPKLWFISIGSNDLFEEKCTDRFVVASILNVIKAIADLKPDAHFIIHGILPRKDDAKSKTEFLKKKWKYAQMINTQVRKFCEHSTRLFYMQAGPLFLKETKSQEWKGRRTIDQQLLEDGMYPTKRGMEVWGDYIVTRVKQILQDIEQQKTKGLKGQSRQLEMEGIGIGWTNWTIPNSMNVSVDHSVNFS